MLARALVIVVLVQLAITGVQAQTSGPAAAVRAFYSFEKKASQVFNRRNLDLRREWISPRLYRLFREELRKQEAHLKTNPDEKPFFGDGFPFLPIYEACDIGGGRSVQRNFSTGKVRHMSRSRSDVPVRFSYPKPCAVEPIFYTAIAVRSGSKWLVDDILFTDGSSLSRTMKDHRY